MDELLFVYGSLRDSKVQLEIIGRLVDGTPDILLGYDTSTVKLYEQIYPILVPKRNGVINGEVLRLTKDELAKIDIYETDAYRRVKITLKSGLEVWVYMK